MFELNDPQLAWAISKSVAVVLSGFASIILLAWVGHKKISPK
jgi:hypothetical protein